MATTPNMGLVIPDDHTDADTWGLALNTAFGVSGGGIDAHDHSTGKGVQVPSAGININADLSFAGFALTGAKGIGFSEVATTSVTSYTDLLFVNSADHNLYFRNSSGTNVQVTAGNQLNVSIVGGIGGDYASVSALLSYVDASKDYLLQQEGSPRPWAGLETGDIRLYQKAANIVQAVTLKSPNSLAAGYTVTWPTALPGAAKTPLLMDSTGQVTASNVLGADIGHTGTFEVAIPFVGSGNDSNVTVNGLGITTTNASNHWESPIHGAWGLRVGDRIQSLVFAWSTAPAGSYNVSLYKIDMAHATEVGATQIQTWTITNPVAGVTNNVNVSSPIAIATTERWFVTIGSIPNAATTSLVTAMYDHP